MPLSNSDMVQFRLAGLTLAVDFTAPALLALTALLLPQEVLLRTLAACLLHENAHFLALALTGQNPELLRISAAGMRLELRAAAICPLHSSILILAAGPAANFLAAALFHAVGHPESAAANLALALFNLLPYRSTDGGSLLYLLLEHRFLEFAPERPRQILRTVSLLTTAAAAGILFRAGIRNPSLWGMLIFLLLSVFSEP